jgi:hypothetical protein
MALAIVAVCVMVLLVIENLASRRSTRQHREMARMIMQPDPGATQDELAYDNAERELTTRLLAAQLTQHDYHDGMAALSAADQRTTSLAPPRLAVLSRDSRIQLADLGAAMPAVPPTTIFAAVALASNGATIDNLMRLLGLTNAQALRVMVTTAANGDRQY